jgi:hypothetical protein
MNNNFVKITDEKDVIYKNINNIANSQLKTYITTSNNETINLNYKTIIVNNKDSTSINPVNIIIPKPESNQLNVIYTIITKYIPSGVIDGLSLPVIITLINSTSTTEIKLETNINTVKIIYTNDIWINLNDYNNDLDKMSIVNIIDENQILDLNHINTIIDNSSDDIIITLPEKQEDINVYQSNTVYNVQILYNTGCEVIIKSDKNGYINLNSNNNNVSLLFDKENTKKWIILNSNSLSFFPCINSLKNSNSEVKVKDGITDVLLALPNNKPFQLISTINSFQTTIAILYGTKIQFYNKDYNTQKWYFSSDFEKPDNTIFVDELVSSSISISPDSSLFCLCCFLNTYGNIIRTFYIYRYSTLNNKYELINNKLGILDPYNDNTGIFGEKIVIDINNKIYVNKVKTINTVTKGLNDTINYSYFYVYKIVKYVDVLDNNITKEKIELETIVNSSELLIKNNPINNYVPQNAKFIVLGNNFEVSPSGNSILLTCPYYNSSNVYDKTFVLSIQKIDDPEAKSPYIIESYFENNNKHFGDIMLLKNDDTLICNFLDSIPENTNTYIMKVFIFKKYNKNWEEEYRIINLNFSFNNNDNNPYYDIDNNKILLPYMDMSGDSNILSLITSNTQMSPFFSIYKREGFLWRKKSIINNPVVVNNDTYFIGTKIYMNNQGNNIICLYAYKNENNEFNVSITEIY